VIKTGKEKIEDQATKNAVKKLEDALNEEAILKFGFQYFEFTFAAAATDMEIPHPLKFVPRDVILLSTTNGITVTFAYDIFTRTHLIATSSGAGVMRCLLGRYGVQ
jgi:hypothetical protein